MVGAGREQIRSRRAGPWIALCPCWGGTLNAEIAGEWDCCEVVWVGVRDEMGVDDVEAAAAMLSVMRPTLLLLVRPPP